MALLTKALETIRCLPPEEEWVDHYRVGKDVLKGLERRSIKQEIETPFGGMPGVFSGIPIILDNELPPDVCEFCNKDGKVLYAVTLK